MRNLRILIALILVRKQIQLKDERSVSMYFSRNLVGSRGFMRLKATECHIQIMHCTTGVHSGETGNGE